VATFFDEHLEIGKIPEFGFVDSRLCADRKRLSDLRNHHADLSCRHLHPRMFRHREHQPQLEAQAGHEHLRLVPGLAAERQRVIAGQFRSESFSDQSDLGRADAVD